ncbi:hypothetical protein N7481_001601 [Penicillium waksmanii]|uniref:uncharacterized protein n=1 Tax=Penicillium waksmanii TaxID=69791 RepID=UPI0025467382|nr:uncharacterized protein N7481_001601 [Penicillium waksmanii]KAJ6001192.1 hypothetical protein N7481_001601 [Penicillium waksmanii]
MVHRWSDLEAAGFTGGSNSAKYTGTETGSGTAISEATGNAADKLRSRVSTWDGFCAIFGGSAAAMAPGMALLI